MFVPAAIICVNFVTRLCPNGNDFKFDISLSFVGINVREVAFAGNPCAHTETSVFRNAIQLTGNRLTCVGCVISTFVQMFKCTIIYAGFI